MNFIIPRKQHSHCSKTIRYGLLMLAAASAVLPVAPTRYAQAKPVVSSAEVWPGRRVVLLLPLQLSDKWNADALWGQRLLAPSEHRLRRALEATGKFSVIQTYQFDPVLQRAMQEKLIDKAQVDAMVEKPTLQTATGILDKLGFRMKPLIADFHLEEVRSSGDPKAPSVQVQVLGKLYELNSEAAVQTKIITSDPVKRRASQFDQVLDAADNAFVLAASEFVRPPAEIELPRVEPPKIPVKAPVKAPVKTPAKPVKPTPPKTTKPPVAPSPAPVVKPAPIPAPTPPPPTVVGPPLTAHINPVFNGK